MKIISFFVSKNEICGSVLKLTRLKYRPVKCFFILDSQKQETDYTLICVLLWLFNNLNKWKNEKEKFILFEVWLNIHCTVDIFLGYVRSKCDRNRHRNRYDRRTSDRCNYSGGRNTGVIWTNIESRCDFIKIYLLILLFKPCIWNLAWKVSVDICYLWC